MPLLNLGFAVLLVKMCLCVLPITVGIYLFVASEKSKRRWRNKVSTALFGASNLIPYRTFARVLAVLALGALLFGALAGWVLLLRGFFVE